MERIKVLEEQLREAACLGDIEGVHEILSKGIVNVNATHQMNGWTALHWAAKRGHKDIVSYLLNQGADKTILTSKEETALALATKPEVRIVLGGEPGVTINTSDLPITPSYMKHEPLTSLDIKRESNSSNNLYNHDSNSSTSTVSSVVSSNHSSNTPHSSIVVNKKHSNSYTPPNDELVLKVRIANDIDEDFIEIELNKQTELSYYSLLNICCKELNISSPSHIVKVRKLPNTLIRKDKDIQRLVMFQEIELVLANNNEALLMNGVENMHLNGRNGSGNLIITKGVNNYPSIHKFKNQTILY